MAEMTQRYVLQRAPGDGLDLQIIDRDMADEIRGVASLSGGERFLVSLSLEGNDVHGVLEFPDAYADGIPNFLYSVRPGQYDRVLVCYETPPETAQHGLISALGAEPVFFNGNEA